MTVTRGLSLKCTWEHFKALLKLTLSVAFDTLLGLNCQLEN